MLFRSLADITEDGGCDYNTDGSAAGPGAQAYMFYLLYGDETSGYTGRSGWAMLMNSAAEAEGLTDCGIFWFVGGTGTTGGGYDVTTELDFAIDTARTNCDAAYYSGAESYTDTLSWTLNRDGTSEAFDASGNPAGEGVWDATGMSALSESWCMVFE